MTASADKVLANASTLRAVGSARRTRRLRPCGLSSLGILDTDRNASQDMTRLGLESRRRADLPPSARHATDHRNKRFTPFGGSSNIVENRVSVAKRQSERPSERPCPNTPSPNFAISLHIRGCGDCPRIEGMGRSAIPARRARRLAHKRSDETRRRRRDDARNQLRTPRHDRLKTESCLLRKGATMSRRPVWAPAASQVEQSQFRHARVRLAGKQQPPPTTTKENQQWQNP